MFFTRDIYGSCETGPCSLEDTFSRKGLFLEIELISIVPLGWYAQQCIMIHGWIRGCDRWKRNPLSRIRGRPKLASGSCEKSCLGAFASASTVPSGSSFRPLSLSQCSYNIYTPSLYLSIPVPVFLYVFTALDIWAFEFFVLKLVIFSRACGQSFRSQVVHPESPSNPFPSFSIRAKPLRISEV